MPAGDTHPRAPSLSAALEPFEQVSAAWLFGSHARSEPRADSDVDVAVLLDRSADRTDPTLLGNLASALEQAAGGLLIDLVILDIDAQGSIFCHRVLAEGVLLHERDRRARIDFESRTYSQYLDFRPTWDIAARRSVSGFRKWLREHR